MKMSPNQPIFGGENQRLLEVVWDLFVEQPRHCGYARHLVVPGYLALDTWGLESFCNKLRNLLTEHRPRTLTVMPRGVEGNAERNSKLMADLILLCKGTLETLKISRFPGIPHEFYNKVLGGVPSVLENLVTLELLGFHISEEALLVQVFSSNQCRIQSLAVNCENHEEDLLRVLRIYGGLKKLAVRDMSFNGGRDDQSDQTFLHAIETSPSRLSHLHLRNHDLEHSHLPFVAAMMQGQQDLIVLDLKHNHIFGRWDDDEGWARLETAEFTELFANAVATHPALEELVLMNNGMNNSELTSLLAAAERNPRLTKLNIFCNSHTEQLNQIDTSGEWVQMLPRLTHLRSLVGLFQDLGDQPEWKRLVLPQLSQNTSLVDLCYAGDDFVWATMDNDELETTTTTTRPSQETTRILARNRLLHRTQPFFTTMGNPSFAVWALIIQRLASKRVEASALYNFLRKKAAELPEPRLLLENKGLMENVNNLREENSSLKQANYLLQEENDSVKQDNFTLRTEHAEQLEMLQELASLTNVEAIKKKLYKWRHRSGNNNGGSSNGGSSKRGGGAASSS